MNTTLDTSVRLFASPGAWMEGEAVRQLCAVSRLHGVRQTVGFPDLHPGKGVPVGATFVTSDVIYPHLIGGDIGCGMALWKTDLLRRKAKLDRWAELRFDLEHRWEGSVAGWLQDFRLLSNRFDREMGTIGGGNHFAELQAVECVLDEPEFEMLGLSRDHLVLLVHCGSRGCGHSIQFEHAAEHGAVGITPCSQEGTAYLRNHDLALRWARANRALIAYRFLAALGAEGQCAWGGCHNRISAQDTADGNVWIHRKGAVAADAGPAVIAGTRGSLSYLVKPVGDGESHAWSLAHGAGRKWSRSESRLRARERHRVAELTQTPLGGRVICEPRDLLYEEAPMAYKSIESVIAALEDAGLVEVIATFRPLLTYKTRAVRR
jgi:release factor H-coupled RctB family protein